MVEELQRLYSLVKCDARCRQWVAQAGSALSLGCRNIYDDGIAQYAALLRTVVLYVHTIMKDGYN